MFCDLTCDPRLYPGECSVRIWEECVFCLDEKFSFYKSFFLSVYNCLVPLDMEFKVAISFMIFCLDVLSINESRLSKSHAIMILSVSSFTCKYLLYVLRCIYVVGTYMFKIVKSFCSTDFSKLYMVTFIYLLWSRLLLLLSSYYH